MKILGIDPGVALLGWSVLEKSPSSSRCLAFGCVSTPAHQPLSRRLSQIYDELSEIVALHKPQALAIEALFFMKNAKAIAQVGHARGVALLVAARAGMEVFEYSPREVKLALTGFGGAEKKQMQLMIQRLLGLKEIPKPDDAADAVAVALCHSQYFRPAKAAV